MHKNTVLFVLLLSLACFSLLCVSYGGLAANCTNDNATCMANQSDVLFFDDFEASAYVGTHGHSFNLAAQGGHNAKGTWYEAYKDGSYSAVVVDSDTSRGHVWRGFLPKGPASSYPGPASPAVGDLVVFTKVTTNTGTNVQGSYITGNGATNCGPSTAPSIPNCFGVTARWSGPPNNRWELESTAKNGLSTAVLSSMQASIMGRVYDTINNTPRKEIYARAYFKWRSDYLFPTSNHNAIELRNGANFAGAIQPPDGNGIWNFSLSNENTGPHQDQTSSLVGSYPVPNPVPGHVLKSPDDTPFNSYVYVYMPRYLEEWTDGVTYGTGSAKFTSAHAKFKSGDQGKAISSAGNIPSGATIKTFVSQTEVTLSANALSNTNASSTTVPFRITGRLGTNGSTPGNGAGEHWLIDGTNGNTANWWTTNGSSNGIISPTVLKKTIWIPDTERWYCYELRVRCNDQTTRYPSGDSRGQGNGEVQVWIDGIEMAHWTGLFISGPSGTGIPAPSVNGKINYIQDVNFSYGTGGNDSPTVPVVKYMDNVVVATSYIGPINSAPVPPSFTGTMSTTMKETVQTTAKINTSGTGTITITHNTGTLPSGVSENITTGQVAFSGAPDAGTSTGSSGGGGPGVYRQHYTAHSATAPDASSDYDIIVTPISSNSRPNCSIVSPSEGDTFPSTTSTIDVQATASDTDTASDPNNKVDYVKFSLDGTVKATVTTPTPAGSTTYTTTLTGITAGTHQIKAVATDTQSPPLSSLDVTTDPGRNIVNVTVAAPTPPPSGGPTPANIQVSP